MRFSSAHGPFKSLQKKKKVDTVSSFLSIGLMLNPEHTSRRVEKLSEGCTPSEAAVFRALWGAELIQTRRFKEGSILDSVVWKSSSPEDILTEIVSHAFTRHFPASLKLQTWFKHAQLERLLPVVDTKRVELKKIVDLPKLADSSLDQLRRILTHELQSFPLSFDSVSGNDSILRHTSLLPAYPNPLLGTSSTKDLMHGQMMTRMLQPISIVATFISSGKRTTSVSLLRFNMKFRTLAFGSHCSPKSENRIIYSTF